ncbi:MAG: arginine--tRNA ligase [Bacteroidetes bacterium]|nr:arginine--tRNA ligase [Bacteroidota bacterium]
MDIIQHLQQQASQLISQLYQHTLAPEEILVQPTRKDQAGDYTVVLFPLTKLQLAPLPTLGQQLGDGLSLLPEVARYELVKGFLNLTISDAYWLRLLLHLQQAGTQWLNLPPKAEKAVVEYSSPNTNKPLHLGHLRNNFLGAALVNLLRAAGYPTRAVSLYNDKGIHICKSMLAWQCYGQGETPQSSGLKGDHLVGKYYVRFDQEYRKEVAALVAQGMEEEQAKNEAPLMQDARQLYRDWEAGKPEVIALWQQMNNWVYQGFEQTYARIGVQFDQYYHESDTYLLGKQIVMEGLEKGIFYRQADGSVWVDLTDIGLDQKLLLRSDGTSLYMTQDLGSADLRYHDHHMHRSIYVIGNEQDYHMTVLKEILKRLGRPYAEGIHHLSYGMVDLPSGKMKSREGTVVDADELIDEMIETARTATEELGKTEGMETAELDKLYSMLALGALKYYLLKVDPGKRMLFNPQESIDFKGHTGTFIQYTHARIHGILRRALADRPGLLAEATQYEGLSLHPLERELLHRLQAWPRLLAEAAATCNPALVAQYAYDLSRDYSRFHYEVPVLRAEGATLALRVQLNAQVAAHLAHALALLGIPAPTRM